MGLRHRSGSHDHHEPSVDGSESEKGLLKTKASFCAQGHLHVAYDDEELEEQHPPVLCDVWE